MNNQNNPKVIHDIIYTRGGKFWICKCGAKGEGTKSMQDHQDSIQWKKVKKIAEAVEQL